MLSTDAVALLRQFGANVVEKDLGNALSLFAEGRTTLHVISSAGDAHGACAPGAGPALSAGIRVGAQYRFGS